MQYRVVPGPKAVSGSASDASALFQELINANATNDWKYHSMETITSVPKAGCFSKPVPETSFMLIFYKED